MQIFFVDSLVDEKPTRYTYTTIADTFQFCVGAAASVVYVGSIAIRACGVLSAGTFYAVYVNI